MFTGIVQSVGTIREKKKISSGYVLGVYAPSVVKKVKKGSSILVNGVCLTVDKKQGGLLLFHIMQGTAMKTTADDWKIGAHVNLESALQVGDELGGHLVYGHVDDRGEVIEVKPGTSMIVTIRPPKHIARYIVPQGAVVIDGVSLTIFRKTKKDFSVSLVSYTQDHTTLGALKKGDKVNIESDMLLKYVDIWLKQSHSQK